MSAHHLTLACYDSADDHRLMIMGLLDGDFDALRSLFRRLAASPGESCQFDTQPFVAPGGGVHVRLFSVNSATKPSRAALHGICYVSGAACPAFEWRLTTEEWDDCAELVTGLIAEHKPCHQYLADSPDATVVVAKGEYGPVAGRTA